MQSPRHTKTIHIINNKSSTLITSHNLITLKDHVNRRHTLTINSLQIKSTINLIVITKHSNQRMTLHNIVNTRRNKISRYMDSARRNGRTSSKTSSSNRLLLLQNRNLNYDQNNKDDRQDKNSEYDYEDNEDNEDTNKGLSDQNAALNLGNHNINTNDKGPLGQDAKGKGTLGKGTLGQSTDYKHNQHSNTNTELSTRKQLQTNMTNNHNSL